MGPKSATNSDSSAQSCDNFKAGPQNTQLNTFQTLYFLVPISKNKFRRGLSRIAKILGMFDKHEYLKGVFRML